MSKINSSQQEALTQYTRMLNDTIASLDSWIEDVKTKSSDRKRAEKMKAEYIEDLQDISSAENSPDQERATRKAVQRITKRKIAKDPDGIVAKAEKLLEDLRRTYGIKDQG